MNLDLTVSNTKSLLFLSFSILPGTRFPVLSAGYIVHSGSQDESLQVTISKLP